MHFAVAGEVEGFGDEGAVEVGVAGDFDVAIWGVEVGVHAGGAVEGAVAGNSAHFEIDGEVLIALDGAVNVDGSIDVDGNGALAVEDGAGLGIEIGEVISSRRHGVVAVAGGKAGPA